ncbi:MAG: hypothetical protein J6R59_10490 [Paludibacteraceae bacterium]|nr:hypothetical protein [Paludibacteraceae bacterium]
MFILSKDGEKLINYNNVASIYIQEIYRQYQQPDKFWEIRAMYPAVSEDVLYDTLGTFYAKDECKNTFDRLCDCIVKSREHELIDMGDLWYDYY